MAMSKCGKCDNYGYEVVEREPQGSAFKLLFVQCSTCGNVVGVLDYFNIGQLIHDLAKKLGVDLDL